MKPSVVSSRRIRVVNDFSTDDLYRRVIKTTKNCAHRPVQWVAGRLEIRVETVDSDSNRLSSFSPVPDNTFK
jgi:hypothetical protein